MNNPKTQKAGTSKFVKSPESNADKLRRLLLTHGWGIHMQFEIRKGYSNIPLSRVNQYILVQLLLMGEQQLKDFLLTTITTAMSSERVYTLTLHIKGANSVRFDMTESTAMALSYLLGKDNSLKCLLFNGSHHLLGKLRQYSDFCPNVQVNGVDYQLDSNKIDLILDIISADELKLSLIEEYHQKADKKYKRMNRNPLI